MSHTCKIVKNPLNKSVDINDLRHLKDGLVINYNDHFNLKFVPIGSNQDVINNAIKEYCKYIVCRDTIINMHEIYNSNAYYNNLGFKTEPISNFKMFKEYAQIIVEVNELDYKDTMENGYKQLCVTNKVIGNIGKLFD